MLAVIVEEQRLAATLALVVAASRADRVDVAPVALGLWMDLRVAVDLARRGEEVASALELRQPERVVCSVGPDLERLQRQPGVVDRARRAREVKDEIDRLVDRNVARHIVAEEREGVPVKVFDVLQAARLEIVDADDAVAAGDEVLAKM